MDRHRAIERQHGPKITVGGIIARHESSSVTLMSIAVTLIAEKLHIGASICPSIMLSPLLCSLALRVALARLMTAAISNRIDIQAKSADTHQRPTPCLLD